MTNESTAKTSEMQMQEMFMSAFTAFVDSDAMQELMAKNISAMMQKAFEETMTGYSAPGREIVETKMKQTLIPVIEDYDFEKFQIKLTHMLDSIAKQKLGAVSLVSRRFGEATKEIPKTIKASDLLNLYAEAYESEMSTDDVEVDHDNYDHNGPSYMGGQVGFEFMEDERNYGSHIHGVVDLFIEEHPSSNSKEEEEEKRKHSLKLRVWKPNLEKDDYWKKSYLKECEEEGVNAGDIWYISNLDDPLIFRGLANTPSTKLLAMQVASHSHHLIMDISYDTVEVTPKSRPEADWS